MESRPSALPRTVQARAPRRLGWCLLAFVAMALAARTVRPGGRRPLGGTSGNLRASAFVQAPPNVHSGRDSRELDLRLWSAPAPLLLGSASSPAWAEEYKNDFATNAKRLFDLLTKGAAEVYDPSTEEGAKALGMAYPLPKPETYEKADLQDFLPLAGLFVFALLWGIFVVPQLLDRSDGSKAYALVDKVDEPEKLTEEQEEQTQKAVVKARMPTTMDEDLLPITSSKKRLAPKKKKAGFATQKTKRR